MSLQKKSLDLAKPFTYAVILVGGFIVSWILAYAMLAGAHAGCVKIATSTGVSIVQTLADQATPYFWWVETGFAGLVTLILLLVAKVHQPFSVVLSFSSEKSAPRLPETKPAYNGGDKKGLLAPNPSHNRDENRGGQKQQPVAVAGGPPAAAQTAKKD